MNNYNLAILKKLVHLYKINRGHPFKFPYAYNEIVTHYKIGK